MFMKNLKIILAVIIVFVATICYIAVFNNDTYVPVEELTLNVEYEYSEDDENEYLTIKTNIDKEINVSIYNQQTQLNEFIIPILDEEFVKQYQFQRELEDYVIEELCVYIDETIYHIEENIIIEKIVEKLDINVEVILNEETDYLELILIMDGDCEPILIIDDELIECYEYLSNNYYYRFARQDTIYFLDNLTVFVDNELVYSSLNSITVFNVDNESLLTNPNITVSLLEETDDIVSYFIYDTSSIDANYTFNIVNNELAEYENYIFEDDVLTINKEGLFIGNNHLKITVTKLDVTEYIECDITIESSYYIKKVYFSFVEEVIYNEEEFYQICISVEGKHGSVTSFTIDNIIINVSDLEKYDNTYLYTYSINEKLELEHELTSLDTTYGEVFLDLEINLDVTFTNISTTVGKISEEEYIGNFVEINIMIENPLNMSVTSILINDLLYEIEFSTSEYFFEMEFEVTENTVIIIESLFYIIKNESYNLDINKEIIVESYLKNTFSSFDETSLIISSGDSEVILFFDNSFNTNDQIANVVISIGNDIYQMKDLKYKLENNMIIIDLDGLITSIGDYILVINELKISSSDTLNYTISNINSVTVTLTSLIHSIINYYFNVETDAFYFQVMTLLNFTYEVKSFSYKEVYYNDETLDITYSEELTRNVFSNLENSYYYVNLDAKQDIVITNLLITDNSGTQYYINSAINMNIVIIA